MTLKQLTQGQLDIEEALNLLVDPTGTVDLDRLDLEVSQRFRRDFPNMKDLPPIIPLLLWRNRYYLGSPKPLPEPTVAQLKKRTGCEIDVRPVTDKSYREWCYKQEIDLSPLNPVRFVRIFKRTDSLKEVSTVAERLLIKTKTPTEQMELIIGGALSQRASDVHLEPTPTGLRIRYRIDGILWDFVKPQPEIGQRLITALKVKCNMDIAERRVPLDGRFSQVYETGQNANLKLDLRVSTYPFRYGEKAVIRLLPEENPFGSVKDLGFTARSLPIYRKWIQEPQGIVIITGPTGSGKTSTLYTSLQEVAKSDINLVTIEDPIEYTLADINQSQINEAAGMTFDRGLRAMLRQDPDIIMVGEIRDGKTAETAMRAALTGHLVFTTLHTNDALSALPRLKGLGLDPSLISDALLGITAQRLVRKLCPHCAIPYDPTDDDLNYLGLEREQAQPEKWRRAQGCRRCYQSGYLGREALIEVLNLDLRVKRLIREDKISEIQQHLKTIEFCSFRVAAIEKIINGVTTVEELRRVIPYSAMTAQA